MSKGQVNLRGVAPEDVLAVSRELSFFDCLEARNLYGLSPYDAVQKSLQASMLSYTIAVDGRAMAVFGLGGTGFLSRSGVCWMLSSFLLPQHARLLYPFSFSVIRAMFAFYDSLTNIILADNVPTIRWLQHLGFVFSKPFFYGVRPSKCLRFSLTKDAFYRG